MSDNAAPDRDSGRMIYPATAINIDGKAVLITGKSRAGKSELALSLIDRGAQFIGDDQITLTRHGEAIYANPCSNIKGRLEVRNLGIIDIPFCENIAVALVISLDENAPRWREKAEIISLLNVQLPLIPLTPHNPILSIKTLWALRHYG